MIHKKNNDVQGRELINNAIKTETAFEEANSKCNRNRPMHQVGMQLRRKQPSRKQIQMQPQPSNASKKNKIYQITKQYLEAVIKCDLKI